MVRALAVFLALLLLAGIAYLAYLGAFAPVELVEERVGPFSFAYVDHVGGYADPVPVVERVREALAEAGVAGCQPLALYHAADAEGAAGRSEIGCAIDVSEATRLSQRVPAQTWLRVRRIVARHASIARFPRRNRHSFVVGFARIDPVLQRHRAERGYAAAPLLVLLDADVIRYAVPIVEDPTLPDDRPSN